jgi:TonB family protein
MGALGFMASSRENVAALPPQPVPSPPAGQEAKPAQTAISGLTVKVLQVKGGLPADIVQQALEAELSRFEKCYQEAQAKEVKLPATVALQVTIGSDGKVIKVRQVGKALTNATLAKCLLTAMQEMAFPKPSTGQVEVKVQFRLAGR